METSYFMFVIFLLFADMFVSYLLFRRTHHTVTRSVDRELVPSTSSFDGASTRQKYPAIYVRSVSSESPDCGMQQSMLHTYFNAHEVVPPILVFMEPGEQFGTPRSRFSDLIDSVMNGSISDLYVTERRILVENDFESIEKIFSFFGCKITVVNEIATVET